MKERNEVARNEFVACLAKGDIEKMPALMDQINDSTCLIMSFHEVIDKVDLALYSWFRGENARKFIHILENAGVDFNVPDANGNRIIDKVEPSLLFEGILSLICFSKTLDLSLKSKYCPSITTRLENYRKLIEPALPLTQEKMKFTNACLEAIVSRTIIYGSYNHFYDFVKNYYIDLLPFPEVDKEVITKIEDVTFIERSSFPEQKKEFPEDDESTEEEDKDIMKDKKRLRSQQQSTAKRSKKLKTK